MAMNSKDAQKPSASEAIASRPVKPTFSPECGPLSESEIASLKELAQQTAREAAGSDTEQKSSPDHGP
jgi:hypothetical protein